MDDDEIDALGRRCGAPEHVARTGDSGRDLAAQPGIAAPETARGVAKAVVPVGEGGAELAEAIAARADVPGLGDEARVGEYGIGGERLKERRLGIEAGVAAAERVREVEAKAIEAAMDHPALERANRHVDDQRAVEREAIAGAGIVDVELRIVRIQPEPGRVVEAAERQGRTQLVALAVVVEDDIENGLHARRMQRIGRCANLGPTAGSQARIGRAEDD